MEHFTNRTWVNISRMLFAALLIGLACAPALCDNPPANFPPPTEWDQPSSAPTAPGDAFAATFGTATPDPNAPAISEWTKTAMPNESFTLTGIRFTRRTGSDAGTDTTVWLWAANGSGGMLRQCRLWKIYNDNILMATVPSDVPFGQYLVWVENQDGVSSPVCLNRTKAEWVGPLGPSAAPGDTKRVFGKNLSMLHGTTTSNVYIQPASGGAFTQCQVSTVDPYSVAFTVPPGTPNGSYNVFVHNGHGGRYGWSTGVGLTVQDAWARGTNVVNLSASGGDDTTAVQGAIDTVSGYTNGGTVQLGSGVFHISSALTIKNKVCLAGAGRSNTTLLFTAGKIGLSNSSANHLAVQDMAVLPAAGVGTSIYSTSVSGGSYNQDVLVRNVDFLINSDTSSSVGSYFMVDRLEIDNCKWYGNVGGDGRDWWIHDNELHGNRPWSEAAISVAQGNSAPHGRYVIENNTASTPNWPAGDHGDYYYMGWNGGTGWLTQAEFNQLCWCPRLINWSMQTETFEYVYLSHNTTNDCAIIDNRGEQILLHGSEADLYCQVASNSGRTLTIRTDGSIDGKTDFSVNDGGSRTVFPFIIVPTNMVNGQMDNKAYVIIAYGTGIGQYRKIVSHTASTITVDSDWRVQPASDSRIIIDYLYKDHTMYQNTLHGFPNGFKKGIDTASCGVCMDGNAFGCTAEGTKIYRTEGGDRVGGCALAPGYFNEARDEAVYDTYGGGHHISAGMGYIYYASFGAAVGPISLGNFYRGGTSPNGVQSANVADVYTSNLRSLVGCAVEGMQSGPIASGNLDDTLYRNNTITASDTSACVTPQLNSQLMLASNSYVGGSMRYNRGSLVSCPMPEYKLARFNGYAGMPADQVVIPVANVGMAGMTWTVTPSDSWITGNIVAYPTLTPESEMGRLVLSVDTTGMSAGTHWGYVDITTTAATARVGVRVDLAAGPAPNNPPTAALTATPSAGTQPCTVVFNAGASSDSDGSIQSYSWDFGDGSYGSGVTTSHIYTGTGLFIPVLTVTDNSGNTDSAYTTVSISPALTSVTLAANPAPPVDAGTNVTLTATANGGYQTLYKFLARTGNSGWTVIRDYQVANSCTWAPSVPAYYEVEVMAKASDSTRAYDAVSAVLGFPYGVIPATGMAFWLKSDVGVTKDASNLVSDWADQVSGSSKRVSQSNINYKPTWQDNVLNGKPVIHFGGNSQALSTAASVLTGTGPFTAFAMARVNAVSQPNYQYLWWNGTDSSTAGYGVSVPSSNRLYTSWGSQTSYVRLTPTVVAGTWYRMSSRYTSGTHEGWLNGTFINSNSPSSSSLAAGFAVGNCTGASAYQGLVGDVAEILLYSRKLTETERQGVESYLTTRWSAITPVGKDRLMDVKSLGDGVLVSITSPKVATASSGTYSDGGIYITEGDRTCGMKILNAGTVSLWDNLTLTGTTDTDVTTGEKILRVTHVDAQSAGVTAIGALGMTNKTLTPSGQLLTVWGKVTSKTASYITIDDGSGSPVKAQIDGLVSAITKTVNSGDYISVTGPCGYMAGGVTAVRVRSDSDIQVY